MDANRRSGHARNGLQSPLAIRLKVLRDIANLINAGSDLPTILQRIVVAVCEHTARLMGGIRKVDLESGLSEPLDRHGPGPPASGDLSASFVSCGGIHSGYRNGASAKLLAWTA